jgi:riboflavin synthase
MFTGIVEALGEIMEIRTDGANMEMEIRCPFADELKPDQSVAHNGVCLTVTSASQHTYRVTAIAETLRRTNLGLLKRGDRVNLERSLVYNDRIDGHLVQGHVDAVATCNTVKNENGSFLISFHFEPASERLVVSKGSICVDGVSLTAVESGRDYFSVAIIPYTWEHTNLHGLNPGKVVNVEFDILGKYITTWLDRRG